MRGLEQGAASILISLADSTIKVTHGEDGAVLAKKEIAVEGDWDKIIVALQEIGIELVV